MRLRPARRGGAWQVLAALAVLGIVAVSMLARQPMGQGWTASSTSLWGDGGGGGAGGGGVAGGGGGASTDDAGGGGAAAPKYKVEPLSRALAHRYARDNIIIVTVRGGGREGGWEGGSARIDHPCESARSDGRAPTPPRPPPANSGPTCTFRTLC